MNDLERAVVDAAIAYASDATDSVDFHNILVDKVDALLKHRGPHITPEEFGRELEARGQVRAAHIFLRGWQHSHRKRDILGANQWPPIYTLTDFAELSWGDIVDVPNAGPKTWGSWITLLREHGLEPAWADLVPEGKGK